MSNFNSDNPCDMEYLLNVEEALDAAKAQELDCVMVGGFKGEEPHIFCSMMKDRYRAVGLLEQMKIAAWDDDPEHWGEDE